MKILYHHRTLGDGAEGIHIQEMVNAFREAGHDVYLAGPAVGTKHKNQNNPSLMSYLKKWVKGPAYEMMEIIYNIFGFLSLKKAVKEFNPDFIYDRYITFNYSSIAIGKKFNIPVFLEVNSPLAYERDHEPDEKLFFKKLAYYFETRICNDSFKTIVVSTPLMEYLISVGVDKNKVVVMPNGVNADTFQPKEKQEKILKLFGISQNTAVVGFSGILRPWHGIDLLLSAFQKVHIQKPDTVLLLIGDGPIRNDIETMAEKMNISDVLKISGRLNHADISDYISVLDIAVSPRATFYASPMKIPEYMAQKKAVIAPDTKNIRDLIKSGITGLLFKDGDVDSLSECMMQLLDNLEMREKISNNAYQETRNRLSWNKNVCDVLDLYINR